MLPNRWHSQQSLPSDVCVSFKPYSLSLHCSLWLIWMCAGKQLLPFCVLKLSLRITLPGNPEVCWTHTAQTNDPLASKQCCSRNDQRHCTMQWDLLKNPVTFTSTSQSSRVLITTLAPATLRTVSVESYLYK